MSDPTAARRGWWTPLRIGALLLGLSAVLLGPSAAADAAARDIDDATALPHQGSVGQSAYLDFLMAAPHRVFALAPGGAFGWAADTATLKAARREAMQTCGQYTQQTCVSYAEDDAIVFNQAQWPTLWGPYKTAAEAAAAPVGTLRAQRFPDIAFTGPDGRPATIADHRGKVTFVQRTKPLSRY